MNVDIYVDRRIILFNNYLKRNYVKGYSLRFKYLPAEGKQSIQPVFSYSGFNWSLS